MSCVDAEVNNLGSDGAVAIAHSLKTADLHFLDINRMTHVSCLRVEYWLTIGSSFGQEGAKAMEQCLPYSKLHTLYMCTIAMPMFMSL